VSGIYADGGYCRFQKEIIMSEATEIHRKAPATAFAWLWPGIAASLIFASAMAAAAAPPKPTSCPLMITACGCVIDRVNTYVAANDLDATASNQICIEVAAKASGAILNLMGFHVFGT